MSLMSLAPVFHAHQPPGSPDKHVEDAYQQRYKPLLLLLTRLKNLKATLHIDGWLQSWIARHHPTFIERTQDLVQARRLELLGGAWADPFLGGIPERDALGQLQWQIRLMTRRFKVKPRGAWLAELGWDPSIPGLLTRSGYTYALIDAGALEAVGVRDPWGVFHTERHGARLALLPVDRMLRELLPPKRSLEVPRSYLDERMASGVESLVWACELDRVLPLDDDKHSLKALAAWLKALDARDHEIRTVRAEDLFTRVERHERVYPGGWFPRERMRCAFDPDSVGLGIAAPWERFLVRYEEANRLHKRMLLVSAQLVRLRNRIRETPPAKRGALKEALDAATLHLYSAQASDVFWHGPHPGIYDARLRHRVWRDLLEADSRVAHTLGEGSDIRQLRLDYDADGRQEIVVRTARLGAVVDPDLGGSLVELDLWDLPGNIVNTLMRRRERYHDELDAFANLPALVDESLEEQASIDTEAEAFSIAIDGVGDRVWSEELVEDEESDEISFYDDDDASAARVAAIQIGGPPPLERMGPEELVRHVVVDRLPRVCFTDHFLGVSATLDNIARGRFEDVGDFAGARYQVLTAENQDLLDAFGVTLAREGHVRQDGEDRLVQVSKRFVFHRDLPAIDVRYEITNRYHTTIRSRFAVGLSFGLDGLTGAGRVLDFGRTRALTSERGQVEDVNSVVWIDERRRLRVRIDLGQRARIYHFPLKTVSSNGRRLDLVDQGFGLLVAWPLQLWGEERSRFDVSICTE